MSASAALRGALSFVWCVVDHYLSYIRWYRRRCGGHWEKRWIGPPVASVVWMRNEHGNPVYFSMLEACEDYPAKPSLRVTGGAT
jgi:hypothetical protein